MYQHCLQSCEILALIYSYSLPDRIIIPSYLCICSHKFCLSFLLLPHSFLVCLVINPTSHVKLAYIFVAVAIRTDWHICFVPILRDGLTACILLQFYHAGYCLYFVTVLPRGLFIFSSSSASRTIHVLLQFFLVVYCVYFVPILPYGLSIFCSSSASRTIHMLFQFCLVDCCVFLFQFCLVDYYVYFAPVLPRWLLCIFCSSSASCAIVYILFQFYLSDYCVYIAPVLPRGLFIYCSSPARRVDPSSCFFAGVRDGLLLQAVLVWPEAGIQLPRSPRVFPVMAVPGPCVEARHFLLKRQEIALAPHHCSQQVSAPAQRRVSHVFHEVKILWSVHGTMYLCVGHVRKATASVI